MFDIGWTELLLIGVVALIVVGPKDLPGMFRTLGRFTAKAKGMAREFSRAMEDAADESGVKDVAGDLRKMTSAKNLGLDTLKDAASKFEKWDPSKAQAANMGPETAALSKERAETLKKIQEATAKKASERLAKEAAENAAEVAPKAAAAVPAKKTPAKVKTTAKPTVEKTHAVAKPPVAKKTTAKKSAAKKPAAKKSTPNTAITKPKPKASE